ncbi:MAG TPA: hypothetical protein VFE67_07105 [Rudaea sp.]|jgi:hypothetical protein|nr:hypothetical protein [Rudaea sp.]
MNDAARKNSWYRVPEVWLMIVMLGATVIGSLALVATAFGNRDELPQVGPRIASPLPPTSAARPADQPTP